MKALLSKLVYGQSLRHRPVALDEGDQRPVSAAAGGERDVTASLFPVSLSPLLLGLWRPASEPAAGALDIAMRDSESGAALGTIGVAPAGVVEHGNGRIDLLRPTQASVRCAARLEMAVRYALAWRQVRSNARRPHAFQMSFADLRALNVFYMMPRPVHLVSVRHGEASNLFPMDLLGPLGEDRFLLALRLTSPSVETMRASGRIVLGAAPARLKAEVYALGRHHKEKSIDWEALPFAFEPSPRFGFPVPKDALRVRELAVEAAQPVGSHMLFVTRIVSDVGRSDEPQLAHVSDSYARWRERQGRPFADA